MNLRIIIKGFGEFVAILPGLKSLFFLCGGFALVVIFDKEIDWFLIKLCDWLDSLESEKRSAMLCLAAFLPLILFNLFKMEWLLKQTGNIYYLLLWGFTIKGFIRKV